MKMKSKHIYIGDCITVMEENIEKECVDLVYADPPYNLSGKSLDLVNNSTGGPFYKMNENWDTWDYDKYGRFSNDWIGRCWDVLRPGGSLYISCTYHNIGEIIFVARKIGFKLNNVITWYKTNAMPNITKRVFTHASEYVCWFVKGKKWKFNYNELKKFNPQKTKSGQLKQMRDFIELPIVQGSERLKKSDGRAIHPTQKPEKLIEMILIASSEIDDLILDPFFGTGTTGVVAEKLHRRWIGIEINHQYANIAEKRIFGKIHAKRRKN